MRHFLEEMICIYRDRTITTDQSNFNITLLEDFLACMAAEMKTNTVAQSTMMIHSKVYQRRFDMEQQTKQNDSDKITAKRKIEIYEQKLRLLEEHGNIKQLVQEYEDKVDSTDVDQLEDCLRNTREQLAEVNQHIDDQKMKLVVCEQESQTLSITVKKLKKRNKMITQNREVIALQCNTWFQKWKKLESMLRSGQSAAKILEFAMVVL